MSIFGSSNNKNDNTTSNSDFDTVIGSGTSIYGNISSKGNLRIDGRLDGNIDTSGHVVIGSTGIINGNISAENLNVAGAVKGNALISGNLSIHPSGQLVGDVKAKSLNIAEGGIFHGCSNMDLRTPSPQE